MPERPVRYPGRRIIRSAYYFLRAFGGCLLFVDYAILAVVVGVCELSSERFLVLGSKTTPFDTTS